MALLNEILKCQQEIKLTQENHTAILNSLLRHNSINCQVLQLHEDINMLLPLKSLEALEILEEKLRDPDIFKTVVCRMAGYLGNQGVCNLVEATGRMMEKLMTKELARRCNLCGRNGKKGLKGSLLFLSLTKAIKRNALTSKSNVRKVEISLFSWLMGSRDRDGNRAKRAKVFKNTHLYREVSPDKTKYQ